VNVFEAGIAALAVCFATGLPGDWARRRASGAMAGLMQVVTGRRDRRGDRDRRHRRLAARLLAGRRHSDRDRAGRGARWPATDPAVGPACRSEDQSRR